MMVGVNNYCNSGSAKVSTRSVPMSVPVCERGVRLQLRERAGGRGATRAWPALEQPPRRRSRRAPRLTRS